MTEPIKPVTWTEFAPDLGDSLDADAAIIEYSQVYKRI